MRLWVIKMFRSAKDILINLFASKSQCRICSRWTSTEMSYCKTCHNALSSANYYIRKNDVELAELYTNIGKIRVFAYNGKRRKQLDKWLN